MPITDPCQVALSMHMWNHQGGRPEGKSLDTVLNHLFDDHAISKKNYGCYGERMRPYFEDLLIGNTFVEAKKTFKEMHIVLEDAGRGMTLDCCGNRIGVVMDETGTIVRISMLDFSPTAYNLEKL